MAERPLNRGEVGLQRPSSIWTGEVIADIQTKAELGRYRIQGFSTRRRVPNFDDLTFVPCTLSRLPLEGYRERCETKTVLGGRFASKPIILDRPITISGMSYGALSKTAKTALGTAATRLGTGRLRRVERVRNRALDRLVVFGERAVLKCRERTK